MPRLQREVPVTAESPKRPLGNNSPVLASDPNDPDLLALAARIDGPDFNCTLHLSEDGGRSWAPLRPVPILPKGADKCYAASVEFDARGTMHYLFSGLAGTANSPMGVFLTSSEDRGREFSTPLKVLAAHSYMVQMSMDHRRGKNGRLHLVWVSAGSEPSPTGFSPDDNPILARFSDDGGETFSKPVKVSDPDRPRAVRPAAAVGRNGALHVLYYDLKDDSRDYLGLEGPVWDGTWSLVESTSQDGGLHFSRGAVVDDSIVPPERIMLIFNSPPPALAADEKGAVYAGWWDARNGDWDVFVSTSKTQGFKWSAPIRVNDDAIKNGRHQYLPGLSVSPSGRIDTIFYDRRRDPENIRNDVFYAFSADGGKHFAQNLRLNDRSSDTRIGLTYDLLPASAGLHEYGSHPAAISTESRMIAAWTDTSNGDLETYQQQNIFSGSVSIQNPEQMRPFPPNAVILAVFLTAGLTVAALIIGRFGRGPRRKELSASEEPEYPSPGR